MFLTEGGDKLSQAVVRIFDLEGRDQRTVVTVHQFGDVDQKVPLNESLNLMVWRGHMRFLLPTEDTRATSWRGWQQQVDVVLVHPWVTWNQVMD